jgi:hypothetical protein
MELLDEIISSRRVGYRRIDPNRGGWEDFGIEKALEQPGLLLRYKKTMAFILESTDLYTLREVRILDTGEYNPLSKWLEDKYGIRVCNTPPDLDFDYAFQEDANLGQFDYIFAFEILEHLMNPLVFLRFPHHHLLKFRS